MLAPKLFYWPFSHWCCPIHFMWIIFPNFHEVKISHLYSTYSNHKCCNFFLFSFLFFFSFFYEFFFKYHLWKYSLFGKLMVGLKPIVHTRDLGLRRGCLQCVCGGGGGFLNNFWQYLFEFKRKLRKTHNG